MCRARIRAASLPGVRPAAQDENPPPPSVAERPVRLARVHFILQREERQMLLDMLIARRQEILSRQQQPIGAVSTPPPPVTADSISSSSQGRQSSQSSQLLSSSQGFSSPIYFGPPSQDDRPIPTYSVPDAPSSQLSQLSRQSQTALMSDTLDDVQMHIGIVQSQLNSFDSPQLGGEALEHDADEGDDDSLVGEDEEEQESEAVPVEVLGLVGANGRNRRGRHTQYKVLWSDGRVTVNPTAEVEEKAFELLRLWRRRNATANNARSRDNKRLKLAHSKESHSG